MTIERIGKKIYINSQLTPIKPVSIYTVIFKKFIALLSCSDSNVFHYKHTDGKSFWFERKSAINYIKQEDPSWNLSSKKKEITYKIRELAQKTVHSQHKSANKTESTGPVKSRAPSKQNSYHPPEKSKTPPKQQDSYHSPKIPPKPIKPVQVPSATTDNGSNGPTPISPSAAVGKNTGKQDCYFYYAYIYGDLNDVKETPTFNRLGALQDTLKQFSDKTIKKISFEEIGTISSNNPIFLFLECGHRTDEHMSNIENGKIPTAPNLIPVFLKPKEVYKESGVLKRDVEISRWYVDNQPSTKFLTHSTHDNETMKIRSIVQPSELVEKIRGMVKQMN